MGKKKTMADILYEDLEETVGEMVSQRRRVAPIVIVHDRSRITIDVDDMKIDHPTMQVSMGGQQMTMPSPSRTPDITIHGRVLSMETIEDPEVTKKARERRSKDPVPGWLADPDFEIPE
jgi:hypothetical protein